jgi:hypothetical protein
MMIDSRSPRAAFSTTARAPHLDRAAPRFVSVLDAVGAVDEARGGEVGARELLHELPECRVRVADHLDRRVDDLGQVVRRDVRGHADRDPGAAVDEEIRELARKDGGLLERAVVVRVPVDRLFLDVVADHLLREAGQSNLGVAHGGGVVTVDRPEVALPVDELIAHREVLGHADDRVVHGVRVVRVILSEDVADDARRLLVRLVVEVALLPHREKGAAVHGLQAVPDVGEGAPDDHRHGVVEVRALDLVLDRDRNFFFGGEKVGGHFIPAGSGRPSRPPTGGEKPRADATSNIEIPHVQGVFLDELPARLDGVPIRIEKSSSASTASSTLTCRSRLFSGLIVVSQSSSGFISPRPL